MNTDMMDSSDNSNAARERDIFMRALELETPKERMIYLEGACGEDVGLRRRVDDLLQRHFNSPGFLSQPAVDDAPTLVDTTPVTEGPGTQIDRYKLLQKLGEGGFGVVHMAEQKEPVKRRVALKIIKLGMDTKQVVARFEAERQALAMMDHPNIAKVLDAGATETGRPYFVMELVKGVPITKYCDDNSLTTRERLDLFMPVCQAIQHAHQKGIIHRDIKPSNVMITLHDGVPVPKVIDFGIAKATQQELTEKTIFTQYSQFIGTPAYMSPEQAEMSGLDIDTRSDIYSLGVLLYELLVGRTPLNAKELMSGGYDEIRRRIKEEEAPKPSTRVNTLEGSEKTTIAKHRRIRPEQLSSDLRGDLDWIVLKALEKDRTRRYETANGFVQDIKRFLNDEPVTAVAPSKGYLFKKYVRRHRTSLAVAAAIAGLLVAGVTVSSWQAIRATKAQHIADAERVTANEQRLWAQEKQREAEQAEAMAEAEKEYSERLLYGANMNLVQAAFETDNFTNARQLLDETADSPERGFEWDYWQSRMHQETGFFGGHEGRIWDIEFSPDGERVVTSEDNGRVIIWERSSGKEIAMVAAHGRILSLSPDGERILTQSHYMTYGNGVSLADARTGEVLLNNLLQYQFGEFSPDGRRLLVYSSTKMVIVDADTGEALVSIIDLDQQPEPGLAGESLASAHFIAEGHQVAAVISRPQGSRVVRFWDVESGEPMDGEFEFRSWGHYTVSPDFRWFTVGLSGEIKRWRLPFDTTSETEPAPSIIPINGDRVSSFHYSPDSKYLLAGLGDSTARIWNMSTQKEVRKLWGHADGVSAVSWSPDGRWLATGDHAGNVRIWDATDEGNPRIWTKAYYHRSMTSDGKQILTTGTEFTIRDAQSGQPIRVFEKPEVFEEIEDVELSPNGRLLMMRGRIKGGTGQEGAQIWNAGTGALSFRLDHSPGQLIHMSRFSPDSRFLIVGEHARQQPGNQTVQIFSAKTGKLERTLDHRTATVRDAVISPDGRRMVTTSTPPTWMPGYDPEDAGIRIWDMETGELRHHSRIVLKNSSSIAFAPDSQHFAVAIPENLVRVFETRTGRESLTLSGHKQRIWSVSYSPDGRRILTSGDRVAKLWDTRTGRELLTLRGHQNQAIRADFFPDGRRIVTSSWDQTIRIWDAHPPRALPLWTTQEQARQARLERRAQDPGAIKQWLILAPIAEETTNSVVSLDREQIPGESSLRPRADQRVSIDGVQRNWKPWRKDQHKIDFVEASGGPNEQCVAYAVTYIQSDSSRNNLTLRIGGDDQFKIYLNGKEVHRWEHNGSWLPERHRAHGIHLNAGLNTLVFKVVNGTGEWAGSIWITDEQGNSVPGLSVTLDPDETMQVASGD